MINTTNNTQTLMRQERGIVVVVFIFTAICVVFFIKYFPIRPPIENRV